MSGEALWRLTATEAAGRIAAGTLRVEALVSSLLDRYAERDAAVSAWAYIDPASALATARAMDRAGPTGPLYSVPVGLKDIIDTYDMPTAFNSPIYAGRRPVADAACTALLRQAGGLILGKTVTTEFANRHPGPTKHPMDPARTPGGSSSGSAAAVADGQVPLALGTQTTGSTIRPAAYCGVVGYKPTFGEMSRVGVKQQSGSLDTLGLMARSVEDIVLLRDALLAIPYAPVPARSSAPRIGVCRTAIWGDADAATQERIEAVARRCAEAGATVGEVVLPPLFDTMDDVQRRIANFEGARNFGHEKHTNRAKISAALYEGRIRDGERCSLPDYIAAQRQAEAMRLYIEATVFPDYDVLLTPAAPSEAPVGLSYTGPASFNSLWTVLYTPSLTIPAGTGPAGMPLGAQLVGARYRDEDLFATALWIAGRLDLG